MTAYIEATIRTNKDVLYIISAAPKIMGIITKNIPEKTATATDADCLTTSVGDLNSIFGKRMFANRPKTAVRNPADTVNARRISHCVKDSFKPI